MPVDGQDWSSDPFRPEIREGKLFGRGTADMKGFIGTALSLASEIAAAPLLRPIHFALSYDEEVGCAGVGSLLEDIAGAGITPSMALVGEPTSMRVVGAHKSGSVIYTRCHGREGHSSAPEKGANAVMMAGEFVAWIARKAEALKEDRDPRFDPPYTTIQANVIEGGTASNVLARDAVVTWECRGLPDRNPLAIVEEGRDFARHEICRIMRATRRKRSSRPNCARAIPACRSIRIRRRLRSPASCRAPTASRPLPMAPKRDCSSVPAFPPSSAAPARSTRPIARMSISISTSLWPARLCSGSSSGGLANQPEREFA